MIIRSEAERVINHTLPVCHPLTEVMSVQHYRSYQAFLLGSHWSLVVFKENQNAPRPSEHPPVMGKKMSKRLGGIKGCKYKTSSWHLNRFPDADNIGSTL